MRWSVPMRALRMPTAGDNASFLVAPIVAPIFLGNAGFAIFALLAKGQGSDLIIGKELVALVVSLVGSFVLIGRLWFGNALAEELHVRPARPAVRFFAILAGFVGGAGFSVAGGHAGIWDFFSLGSSISILLIGGQALVWEIFVRWRSST